MSPNTWGPPLWKFLHSFSINISDEGYDKIGKQFFNILYSICKSLPCPECASHASDFIKKVNPNTLQKKIDMVNMIYLFHNAVNKRKMKPMFHYTLLRNYEQISVIDAYNHFVSTFMTNSSRLINENLQRKMLVSQIKKWLMSNIRYFIKPTVSKVETYNQSEETKNENIDNKTLHNIVIDINENKDEIPDQESPENSETETEPQENKNESNIKINIIEIQNINENQVNSTINNFGNEENNNNKTESQIESQRESQIESQRESQIESQRESQIESQRESQTEKKRKKTTTKKKK
jgi:hypothetical protein